MRSQRQQARDESYIPVKKNYLFNGRFFKNPIFKGDSDNAVNF